MNNLRYRMYRASGGVASGEKLLPCFDSLNHYIKRANYQAAVWRRSLECNPTFPDPVVHGWSEVGNGINIVWNECSPAPNEVQYLLPCVCSRKCEIGTCSCLDSGLPCTDNCHTHECENVQEDFLNREFDALDKEEDD